LSADSKSLFFEAALFSKDHDWSLL